MGSTGRPTLKTENFDMDSFFDFSAGTNSPTTATSSRAVATPKIGSAQEMHFSNTLSPYDQSEERQVFAGPSHEYDRFKQQTGLPVGSIANMQAMSSQQGMFDGYNSGVGDMGFNSGFDSSWSTGIDMDADMGMDFNNPSQPLPAMFFPSGADSQSSTFVDPNSVGGQEEPASNVGRLWPGMHQQQAQQAAMQKQAQAQAMQQRQMKMQAQQQKFQQQAAGGAQQPQAKRGSHISEPHVEESISRLLNQMRNNSTASSVDDAGSPTGSVLPHIARMRKEEEDMDEDERLLASDEGKKLSSKERRQLRNKVSARAFRSRRKEYIGQLEGEVAVKIQEANNLRTENTALLQENERYRGLIETLLRHPAFTPFIDDISKNPAALGAPQPQQHQQSVTPTPAPQQPQQHEDVKPEFLNFDASQLQVPQQQPQQQQDNQQVGLAMIPEEKMDFSRLNIGTGYNMNFGNFQQVNAYAVTELPSGPDPVALLAESRIEFPCTRPSATAAFDSASDDTSAQPSAASLDFDYAVLLTKLGNTARRMRTASDLPV